MFGTSRLLCCPSLVGEVQTDGTDGQDRQTDRQATAGRHWQAYSEMLGPGASQCQSFARLESCPANNNRFKPWPNPPESKSQMAPAHTHQDLSRIALAAADLPCWTCRGLTPPCVGGKSGPFAQTFCQVKGPVFTFALVMGLSCHPCPVLNFVAFVVNMGQTYGGCIPLDHSAGILRPSRVWLLAGFGQPTKVGGFGRRSLTSTLKLSPRPDLASDSETRKRKQFQPTHSIPTLLYIRWALLPQLPFLICSPHRNPFPAATRLALRQASHHVQIDAQPHLPGPAPSQPHLFGDVFFLPILKSCH
jgi:hypothetical protein